MKIIILGAGPVGVNLAEALLNEQHDITLVDPDGDRLAEVQEKLDLRTVVGQVSYPNVLRDAEAEDADMLIAVTDSDEANMIACQVAYSLFNVPKKLARIRSPHYLVRGELFHHDHVPIDIFINPEQLVTSYIRRLIETPGALQVLPFADGKVIMAAVKITEASSIKGKSLSDVAPVLQEVPFEIVAVYRHDHCVNLSDKVTLEVNDEVFIVASKAKLNQALAIFQGKLEPCRRVMIAGGGNVGLFMGQALQDEYQVKIIEQNRDRCEYLASKLNATVLCGEVADSELLRSEDIENIDVFCSVTNDDESNIIGCIQAKRLGANRTIAIITRAAYIELIESDTIDIAISPQQVTVGSILTHLRQGDVMNAYALRHGAAEAIEMMVHGDENTSRVVGKRLDEVKLPKKTVIGAVVREEKVLMPEADVILQAEDRVVLFVANRKGIKEIEYLFQVDATFF